MEIFTLRHKAKLSVIIEYIKISGGDLLSPRSGTTKARTIRRKGRRKELHNPPDVQPNLLLKVFNATHLHLAIVTLMWKKKVLQFRDILSHEPVQPNFH